LALTLEAAARGDFADALGLEPLYPRQPEAVALWERGVR
jgi:hypothetical protein